VNLFAQADTNDPALYQKVRRWLMFVAVDNTIITALSVCLFFSRIFKDSDGGLFGPFSLVFNDPSTTTHSSARAHRAKVA
jgi:hypothetical protein